MPKTVTLLLLGILPLAGGFALNFMMFLPIPGFVFFPVQLALLALWGYLAYRVSAPRKSAFAQALALCAFGLAMLALVLYQELVMGEYWGNLAGFGTQMYFLPVLSVAVSVLQPFLRAFTEVVRVWPLYIAVWVLLFLAGLAGCCLKRRRAG